MKKYLLLLVFLIGFSANAFGFASAMTKIRGGDEIVFNTSISQVAVYLDGSKIGDCLGTVFVYKLNRNGKSRTFVFKKDGYKDSSITVSTQFDTLFWGNALFGSAGFSSSSTDSWSTNNTREYTPNQFFVDMVKN